MMHGILRETIPLHVYWQRISKQNSEFEGVNNKTFLVSFALQISFCPYTEEDISLNDGNTVIINTLHSKLWRILLSNPEYSHQDSNENVLCDLDPQFGQFGIYRLALSNNSCQVETLKEPVNIYSPIISVILLYCLLYLITYSFIKVYQVWFKTPRKQEEKHQFRIQSIDTFRGISIVVMIFANYGCGGYAILDHAIWNGLHLADLVFPWFIWIMGFCIPLSVKSAISKRISKKDMIKNIARRSCVLFCLGIILQSPINLSTVRVLGILQRFGVCYFVVTTAFTLLITDDNDSNKGKLAPVKDILLMKNVWIVGIISVIVHLLFTFLLSAPGCPK
ncbi:heparan-alpha-glucosaminide N-acetyltransferase-like [Agrilus planipennis]|uniref:Heparan-alpha-glucosaminide N-acetyltransferase-like n=1 Tax=Agrilus planipennis TaxID=224129 RepID=A0A7F5RLG4_AGRPL|nr:heparan-alpha-glucosaminide N-acetyltransferase-like [Agrilus planipennis]